MADPYLGQIMQVGWGFVNTGWANCNGALIGVTQNSALFSLLGTTFGGNGTVNFGLPDVQGRVLVGQGQGQGLSPYVWGQKSGTEMTTLNTSQMPAHTHAATFSPTGGPINASASLQAITGVSTQTNIPAAGSILANTANIPPSAPVKIYAPAGSSGTAVNLGGLSVSVTGGTTGGTVTNALTGSNQPFSNLQPYLAVWTLIALSGVYPTRS